MTEHAAILCRTCGTLSFHTKDVRERHCGRCNVTHADASAYALLETLSDVSIETIKRFALAREIREQAAEALMDAGQGYLGVTVIVHPVSIVPHEMVLGCSSTLQQCEADRAKVRTLLLDAVTACAQADDINVSDAQSMRAMCRDDVAYCKEHP